MARARERAAIAQVGIRSIAAEEAETIDRARVVWAHEIAAAEADPAAGRSVWVERVLSMVGSGPVYVTVDLDVFDAGVMPATGTPEPGGLDWWQVTGLLAAVSRNARIVGLDVVELCPTPGAHGAAFLAAKLAYRGVALALATPNGAAR
jgi:agmatinase